LHGTLALIEEWHERLTTATSDVRVRSFHFDDIGKNGLGLTLVTNRGLIPQGN